MSDVSNSCRATLTRIDRAGMITLRGDLNNSALNAAVKDAVGASVPEPNACEISSGQGVAWMSPDELLILTPYDTATEVTGKIREALDGHHHLAEVVSDARAYFRLEGADAREVLGKLTPADLSSNAFGPGSFRRSRLGQVAAAFWMEADGTIGIICFRSTGDYLRDLLEASINGGRVGFY